MRGGTEEAMATFSMAVMNDDGDNTATGVTFRRVTPFEGGGKEENSDEHSTYTAS